MRSLAGKAKNTIVTIAEDNDQNDALVAFDKYAVGDKVVVKAKTKILMQHHFYAIRPSWGHELVCFPSMQFCRLRSALHTCLRLKCFVLVLEAWMA